ncbi:MAG: ATP-binding protein [Anaerolineae bacterium]|nr:ATP-binding protein [Anaerolineae bacterium]
MLKASVRTLRALYRARVPTLVWGPPGVGKTAMIEALAEEAGAVLLVPHVRAPEDMAVPVPVHRDGEVAEVRVVPTSAFAEAVRAAQAGRPAIVFLDELNTLSAATMAAALRFLDSGRLGDTRLPENVWRVGAANPPEMSAGGRWLPPPAANRLIHLEYIPSAQEWAEGILTGWGRGWNPDSQSWALVRGLLAAFMRARPELLLRVPSDPVEASGPWPSPRSWTMGGRAMSALLDDGASLVEAAVILEAAVGPGPAAEFISWVRDLDLPDPEMLLDQPSLFDWAGHPADRCFAALSGVVAYAVSRPDFQDTWKKAWRLVGHVFAIRKDVAIVAARPLAQAWVKNPRLGIPEELGQLLPFLREVGAL